MYSTVPADWATGHSLRVGDLTPLQSYSQCILHPQDKLITEKIIYQCMYVINPFNTGMVRNRVSFFSGVVLV